MSQPHPIDETFKIVLIGDYGVGKTSMIRQYTEKTFEAEGDASGMDIRKKKVEARQKLICLEIWDTAGLEKENSLNQSFFRGVDGVLVVYDVTNKLSFDSLKKWRQTACEDCDENVQLIVVGNKCEMSEKREVTEEEGRCCAKRYDVAFAEVTATNYKTVSAAFMALTRAIIDKKTAVLSKSISKDLSPEQIVGLRLVEIATGRGLNNKNVMLCC